MPENGNLLARANPWGAGKMKSRQISLALFIKFDNRYRPPEGQKHSAACHSEGSREYGGDPSLTASQSFSQTDVWHHWVRQPTSSMWYYSQTSLTENALLNGLTFGSLVYFPVLFHILCSYLKDVTPLLYQPNL